MTRKATSHGWGRASLATLFVLALLLAPFQGALGAAPDAPVAPATPNWPANGEANISTSPALAVTVPGSNTGNVTVTFYGKPVSATPGADFSVIALPDTENEVKADYQPYGALAFNDETQWVANNWMAAQQNIAFVSHLGDITADGDWDIPEWDRANVAMTKLEANLPNVTSPNQIPIGIVAGKMDVQGGGALFEQYFGVDRFTGRTYYGGSFDGASNLDNFVRFSAGGMNFIVVDLFCPGPLVPPVANPPDDVLTWAGNLLKANASSRAIVVCHALFDTNTNNTPPDFTPDGARVFNALKDNPNFFLLLGGYKSGKYLRQDTYNGRTIYSMSADFQYRTYLNGSGILEDGGVGWMRQLKFSPASDQIAIHDFSPHTGQADPDPAPLSYNMHYQVIGEVANVAPGTLAKVTWPGLAAGTAYEWYAAVDNGQGTTNSAHWTFTTAPAAAPTVTGQPADVAVNLNPPQTASFTATATGTPTPTVQWQLSTNNGSSWSDIAGATNTTYTTASVVSGDNGKAYRAIFTNTGGSVTSRVAVLTTSLAPAITLQPANVTVNPNTLATFTATASGRPTPTVQWQWRAGATGSWSNITGAITTTYSYLAPATDNGKQFRAVFTNMAGFANSNAATLTVNQPPAVTTQPANLTVNAGQMANFAAAASGSPAPTVQWQVSTDGGSTWADISGATSPTYSFPAAATDHGKQFRAVFTNVVGTATSNAATLTVNVAPAVTTQPANQTANPGQTATFTAAASGRPTPTVKWQVSTNGGSTWTDIAGATNPSYTTPTLVAGDNGKQYRAVFTNSVASTNSNAATLTVGQPPIITLQPTDLGVMPGQTATFVSAASGATLWTIQWQVSTNGGSTWTDIAGATNPMYSFVTAAADNGKRFHAVFTNAAGTATSSAATLTIYLAPQITTQPANKTILAGQTASFTAAASGNPAPGVKWQVSTNSGGTWTDIPGATSTTYSFTAQVADNGKQFRAVFTNLAGSATSNGATLTVGQNLVITTNPSDQTVSAGQQATFSAAAIGNPAPSVQWQVTTNDGGTWNNVPGATGTTLTFTAQLADNGNLYRAMFTNTAGSIPSQPARLTVVRWIVRLPSVSR